MRKQRKQYSAQEKVAMLRLHLLEKRPVSDLCEKHDLQPTVFYRWLREFFENGAAAFAPKPGKKALRQEQRKMEAMEAKLRKKDEVLAELMEEHVALKKSLGED
jgi:transposase-like protein